MNRATNHAIPPKRKKIPPRPLTVQERMLIEQILQANAGWADVDVSGMRVVAECDCGECGTVYLDSDKPQNPSARGTSGYLGRLEIRTTDDFGITVSLDQADGKLDELYINGVDLGATGDRRMPKEWQELSRVTVVR